MALGPHGLSFELVVLDGGVAPKPRPCRCCWTTWKYEYIYELILQKYQKKKSGDGPAGSSFGGGVVMSGVGASILVQCCGLTNTNQNRGFRQV